MGLFSSIGGVLGSFFGGTQADAARDAAGAQTAGYNRAGDIQQEMFDTIRGDYEPYRQVGYGALNQLGTAVLGQEFAFDEDGKPIPGALTDVAPENRLAGFHQDPGYQFRLGEGQKAIERSAAARGNLLSGSTGKALQRFGQDYASNEYGNYINRLSGLAGMGQQATGSTSAAGLNTAANRGQAAIGAGGARASGYIGEANAYGQGLQNVFGAAGVGASFFV